MDLLVGFHLHFARNGMLKHPIPYIGMDAQANLTVGSGEKRLSFRSSENASRTIVHYSMYVVVSSFAPGQGELMSMDEFTESGRNRQFHVLADYIN